ncbi:MAG TPA: PilT/PilU family type 4a pilus ATPase [Gemmatimonadaceae bacterium]|nr:PilT/PilU family type 4a pilus ATPase [Gemmatimonadaceae bacterium]
MKARIDELLRTAVERGASDLHLRAGAAPMLRVNGEIHRLPGAPLEAAELSAMLAASMDEDTRTEFTANLDADYAYDVAPLGRFRVNALHDRRGPAAVFRHIPAAIATVETLGLSVDVQRVCELRRGLVLVTGPTGSGKSTTLCALIDQINRTRRDHIVTIEDPIEFVHQDVRCVVTQREVGAHTRSFKRALRAALREDPDVVLIGEMRDLETMSIALETAETGHLVFGTLHTTTATAAVDRIIDQYPTDQQEQIRTMLADTLVAVIAQTLCRRIDGGRVAAREILFNTPAVANLIREGKAFQISSIMQTSRAQGMVTLNAALEALVDQRVIDAAEAYSHAVEKPSLLATLKRKGVPLLGIDDPAGSRAQMLLGQRMVG